MKGHIFDIEKFALADGPGIRTVVFLKGCPLRCKWCSNPESQIAEPQLMFLSHKCDGCMECLDVCTQAAIKIQDGEVAVQHKACNACGLCLDYCLPGALKIVGQTSDSDKIINEIIKDKHFFAASGGGVTLSGGEPLIQGSFSIELLKKVKDHGINTAVETCGMASSKIIKEAARYTDTFLFDFKISNETDHIRYTGRSQKQILENLRLLNELKAKVILRCIIIPGINDTTDHFEAIARLATDLACIDHVEIMPYHQYGSAKYKQLGMKECSISVGSATKDQAVDWQSAIKNFGYQDVMIGS